MANVTPQSWFLAQIKPNCQNVAKRNLQRQGFNVFAPMERITRRQSDRFVGAKQLLFPGYIFVGFEKDLSPWRSINSTYGVNRLVSFRSGEPEQVPNSLITGLKSRCGDDDVICPELDLTPGSKVRFTSGPFADFVASIETIEPNQRAWILMDMKGSTLRMTASAMQLRSA